MSVVFLFGFNFSFYAQRTFCSFSLTSNDRDPTWPFDLTGVLMRHSFVPVGQAGKQTKTAKQDVDGCLQTQPCSTSVSAKLEQSEKKLFFL